MEIKIENVNSTCSVLVDVIKERYPEITINGLSAEQAVKIKKALEYIYLKGGESEFNAFRDYVDKRQREWMDTWREYHKV